MRLSPRHLHRHAQRGAPGALADPRLEHPEAALLDGELRVAHVAVVALEPVEDGEQLVVDLGEVLAEPVEVLGVADAGHHVLSLGVDQEVAVGPVLAGGRVAGEADAGAGALVAVAEHHGLDVDRGAQVVADLLAHPVGHGAGRVPRAEHRLDGTAQLTARVLRERLAAARLHDRLEVVAQRHQRLGRDVGVGGAADGLTGRVERRVERLGLDAEHDAPVQRDEATVGVVGEALVAGGAREALHGPVVEPEVEDRVHHPGHRERGARPAR